MTAKILKKSDLAKTLNKWIKSHDVVAPTSSKEGLKYRSISSAEEFTFNGARKSVYPPKSNFLPQSEVLFKIDDGEYTLPEEKKRKEILFGVRPCDARAFWLLDTVLNTAEELDLYWNRKREKALVVAFGCETLCSHGFCDTVGSGPFGKENADILITELDGHYYLDAVTEAGAKLIDKLPNANPAQKKAARETQAGSVVEKHTPADLPMIRERLYESFDSKVWSEVSKSCLGCGICTYLCPTCFCFDIVDETDRSERVRNWDTCMFRVYSEEASGHNPRPDKAARTRQRIMHKFAYWIDNEEASGCTGCGRCVEFCPVNLDIREMVREITKLKVQ